MRVLLYEGLEVPPHLEKRLERVLEDLRADRPERAEVKKLSPTPYFRAKLSEKDRLLLKLVRANGEGAWLVLEVIPNHAYERSRFLRGAAVREEALRPLPEEVREAEPVRHLEAGATRFHYLDKPLTLDEAQEALLRLPPPLVLLGAAGSGKTALALERLKREAGRVLYATQSPFLAQEARRLYFAHGYENPYQEAEFLAFRDFLETFGVPEGREVTFRDFQAFFAPYRRALAFTHAHALFEEFRGVLLASPEGPLSLEAYLALGVRQSLYPRELRPQVYEVFRRYLTFLEERGLYDPSLLAHRYRGQVEPLYDFLVVDEVQDLTLAQLDLLLRSLKAPGRFLLAGDSHQIVHPNFFSWAALKTYFFQEAERGEEALERIRVLRANFRNARRVAELANRLLRLKQARFGSVDRESTYLCEPRLDREGKAVLLQAEPNLLKDLDARSQRSAEVAVLVLREEDKERARAQFRTPLLFSVREAKGLEYPKVILHGFVAAAPEAYREVARGVDPADLEGELVFRRAKDKTDKSLEEYKFFTNALYVALTRAVEEVIWVEEDPAHPFLRLLGLEAGREFRLEARETSREEWSREAARLAQHGNLEQAQAIREAFLGAKPVPWTVWDRKRLEEVLKNPADLKEKARRELLDLALFHRNLPLLQALAQAGHRPAQELLSPWVLDRPRLPWEVAAETTARLLRPYGGKGWKEILWDVRTFGPDFRTPAGATPLMLAAQAGNLELVHALLEAGADPEARDPFGQTPFLYALLRALEDPGFARGPFPALVELLGPTAVDLQVPEEGGFRLVRLYPNHPEFWVFLAALALAKGLRANFHLSERARPYEGLTSAYLAEALGHLPPGLLPRTLAAKEGEEARRTYLNGVLGRNEAQSSYRPARRLFLRVARGRYLPNPHLRLRVREGEEEVWKPLREVLGYGLLGLEELL